MIEDLLDEPYWKEIKIRLGPVFLKDPNRKIFNYIFQQPTPEANIFVLLFDRDFESLIRFYQDVIIDQKNLGISEAVLDQQIQNVFLRLKENMLYNFWNLTCSNIHQTSEELEKSKKEYDQLRSENNLEVIFKKIDELVWGGMSREDNLSGLR